MSQWENNLFHYIEGRLMPMERAGTWYYFRSNSFSGVLQRRNGSLGFINNAKPGMPDVIGCYNGRFIGLELKTKTGKQSAVQRQSQALIESAGGTYYVIRSPEEFEEALKELTHKQAVA